MSLSVQCASVKPAGSNTLSFNQADALSQSLLTKHLHTLFLHSQSTQMLPPAAYLHMPASNLTTKFVIGNLNKVCVSLDWIGELNKVCFICDWLPPLVCVL